MQYDNTTRTTAVAKVAPVSMDASNLSPDREDGRKQFDGSTHVAESLDTSTSNHSKASSDLHPARKCWPRFRLSRPRYPIKDGRPATNRQSRYPRTWRSTFFRWGPLSGVFAMFLAISSVFACLGILVGSNGVAVTKWEVQPSEYLAIFTAIANLAMRYACIQGIVIAWWTRAMQGSTLSKLHWDWVSLPALCGVLRAWKIHVLTST